MSQATGTISQRLKSNSPASQVIWDDGVDSYGWYFDHELEVVRTGEVPKASTLKVGDRVKTTVRRCVPEQATGTIRCHVASRATVTWDDGLGNMDWYADHELEVLSSPDKREPPKFSVGERLRSIGTGLHATVLEVEWVDKSTWQFSANQWKYRLSWSNGAENWRGEDSLVASTYVLLGAARFKEGDSVYLWDGRRATVVRAWPQDLDVIFPGGAIKRVRVIHVRHASP